ncbi:MAG: GIY-YIG nuclease family protein [Bdellovibrio sp.]
MYVYRIRSQNCPNQVYIGITKDFKNQSAHTSRYKPWIAEVVIWFKDDSKARAFEKYLKSGSGRAFITRHF